MGLPEIPLEIFILTPIIFILFAVFTNIRYELRPTNYIGHSTIFGSLIIGFIFLYAMQKYDKIDANVPVVARNIIFLEEMALKYDPSLICYLIEYSENFLSFTREEFPILKFERKIIPLVDDPTVAARITESVTILELISHERITKTNLIVNPIWYTVFIMLFLLTVIFPMDSNFGKPLDSIIVIILIWLPIVVIYYLYQSELYNIENTMEDLIDELEWVIKKKGIKCKKGKHKHCYDKIISDLNKID